MRKKRLAKSVSLMLCAAMTVTMGSVPALAEDLGGDSYEIAFSDDAENFENPAETEPGIEEDSEAEAVPEEASGEEDVAFDVGDGDSEQIDIVDDAQDEEELDIATEEMDVEDFGIAECAGEDGIAVFDDGMTQQGTLAAVYLDPTSGDDTRTGADAGQAVKTLDKAKELLAEDGTVYLLSTLTIDGTDTLENMTIRPASNLSTLVKVAQKGHLTVKNVKVKGENEAGTECKISYAFYVDEGATLDIEGDDTEVGPFVGTPDAGAECVEVRKEATLNFRGGKLLGYSDADNNAYGRGIYVNSGTVNMSGGYITGHITKDGRAMEAFYAVVNLTGGEISGNNTTNGSGAALAMTGGSLHMTGECMIKDNSAAYDGGAIYMYDATAEITAGTISGNRSGAGGGVLGLDSTITVGGSAKIINNAAYNGGGIFIQSDNFTVSKALLTVNGGEISGNQADGSGGGIYARASKREPGSMNVVISGGKIAGNHTGTEEDENVQENAIALMAYYEEEDPTENTGYADLYLSGSPNIDSILIGDAAEYGPKIVVTDAFTPAAPILLKPTYGTAGRVAVSYGSEEAANANKTQFTKEYATTCGYKQDGANLIWTMRYRISFRTFTSFDPLQYTWDKCTLYVDDGETIAAEELPQAETIPGYTRKSWRNAKTGEAWDPASKVTGNLKITEVWALNKPTVTIEQSAKAGCPSSAITLTAKAAHDLDTTTYTYQWYKNDEVLDGQTEATYVAKEGGEYKVVVTAIGAGSNAKSIAETSVKLPAFAHKYSWKSDKKNHWQVCSICNGKVKTATHNYSGWKVTKAAQIAIAGEKVRTCKTCGHKEKAAVAALPVQKIPFLRVTSKEKSVTLRWNTVKDADGYMIYGAECGNNSKYRLLRTVRGNVNSWTHTGLKKATYYRYSVVAYRNINKKKVTIAQTYSMHIATTGKKHAYARNLQVNRTNVVLNRGKRTALRTKVIYSSGKIQNHIAAVRFSSSNSRVATVNSRGIISARNKGTCIIYCYAPNGVRKNVRVTVR